MSGLLEEHARSLLTLCLQDAIERADLELTCEAISGVEGTFVLVRGDGAQPLCLFQALSPSDRPYDEFARDRARSVAARMQTPLFALVNFRRCVVFVTDAVTHRLPDEEQIARSVSGADVVTLDDVRASAASVMVTDALRTVLRETVVRTTPHPVRDAATFLASRITQAADEMIACTDRSPLQRDKVLRLVTSVTAYTLLQMRRGEELDRLSIPWGMRGTRLMLDIVGAYFRDAHERGYPMFPARVDDLHVIQQRADIFRSTLADLAQFLHRFDGERLAARDLHRAVDTILQWCLARQQRAVPTVDVIDVALRSILADIHPDSTIRALEIGPSTGLCSVRLRALARTTTVPDARIYAPTPDDERLILLRGSGHLEHPSDVRIIRRHDNVQGAWDIVCLTSTDVTERHRLRLLLQRLSMTPQGAVILFLPMSALHDPRYATVRGILASRFSIDRIFMSDAQPFSTPDAGLCCIIARQRDANDTLPARFVYIRQPLVNFFPTSDAPREAEPKRIAAIDAFLGYLDASERGKVNEEVLVRVVPQRLIRASAGQGEEGWFDFLVPPDIVAGIVRKVTGRLRPLSDVGHATGGMRTGANDFFLPDMHTIADAHLEMQFWQRSLPNGNMVDTTTITSADELESIAGMPRADHRLLMIDAGRQELEGLNVLTRIEAFEREGIHLRATVRVRDPWWKIGSTDVPHLIVPKVQDGRWIVTTNPVHAFITDAAIGITLTDERLADPLALWMNSTLGLFLYELFRRDHHARDITVRDIAAFPVPTDAMLLAVDIRRHRDFMRRPVHPLTVEYGTDSSDAVRPDGVERDRRRVDIHFMEQVFGLTAEEQRWIYRFAMAWRRDRTNLRQLALALLHEIEQRHRLRPLASWYTSALEQLPDEHRRTILLPDGITRAEATRTMFNWQVSCYRGNRVEDIVDCSSQEEADIVALLAELGKIHVEIPTDAPFIAELLPQLQRFRSSLEHAMTDVIALLPTPDIREAVGDAVRARLVAF